MSKFFVIVIVGLLCCNTANALPKCEGENHRNWTNCEGSLDYTDKIYSGEWKNGKREGRGTSILNDGYKYVGEFKDDVPNGQGIVTQTFNSYNVKFIGVFKDGFPNGPGTLTCDPLGRKYTAEFDAKTYTAEWEDGSTKIKNENGEELLLIAVSCGKYRGEVKDGEAHGQGTFIFPDGSSASGIFKNDRLNGKGTRIYYDGGKYTGEFKNNIRDGHGTYLIPDGTNYVGEWKNGKPNGQGTRTYNDGSKYVGEFKDSLRNGQGTFTNVDGEEYSGEWKNEIPNGKGTITYPNGKIIKGLFKDGKIIKEIN